MEQINYYDLDNLLEQCSNGTIDMHEPIEVTNSMKNKRIEISLLKHFLILCKDGDISLIRILSTLRYNLKHRLLNLIETNQYFKHYIQEIISQWSVSITPDELLSDGLDQCNYNEGSDIVNYEDLLNENKLSQGGERKFKSLEEAIQNRIDSREKLSREHADNIKIKINDVHEECKGCVSRIKHNISDTQSKHQLLDPKYRDILLDLSIKSKSTYLEYLNRMKSSDSNTFSLLLNEFHDLDIPDHIHTIFLNYVITLNMLKKELNYITNSYKKLLGSMQPTMNTLDKFTEGHPELNVLVADDEPMKQSAQEKSILGFSFF